MTELLAIFSLEKEKRIRCQHPDCTKTVYAHVHLVKHHGEIIPVGSTCFKNYFSQHVKRGIENQVPVFSGLTDEEKSQILNNTAQFLLDIQQKYQSKSLPDDPLYKFCQDLTRTNMMKMGMNPDVDAFKSTFEFQTMSLYQHKLKASK